MAKKLVLIGAIVATVNKDRVTVDPGTEISIPDKKYGLKRKDIDRIVESGCGRIEEVEPDKDDGGDQGGADNNGDGGNGQA